MTTVVSSASPGCACAVCRPMLVPDHATIVASAAVRLDARTPAWFHRVDLRTLRMGSLHACVLGQVYGHYGVGLEELYGDDHRTLRRTTRESFAFTAAAVPETDWHVEVERRLADAARDRDRAVAA